MTRGRACALALLVFLTPKSALANGRFPSAGQIAFDPADARHLAVRTTFGLLTSRDRGKTFDYVCESALRLGVEEDPMIAFTASGPLVVGTFGGVLTSQDDCVYGFVPELEGQIVLDLARSASRPDTLVAFRLLGRGGGLYDSSLVRSEDAGASWTFLPLFPVEFLPITVDVAAGDSSRIYVSARRGADDEFDSALLVSSDAGQTFETRLIPDTSGQHLAYIAGVHPSDPDRLWLRIDDPDGTILVETSDAGATFRRLFEADGLLTGFAASPDGLEIAFGGRDDGLWVRSSDDATLERRSDVGSTCLAWNDDGLWACADAQVAQFSLGLSTDRGRTFEPRLVFADLCGRSSCGPDTDVGALCPNDWQSVAPAVGADCDEKADGGDVNAGARARWTARGGCAIVRSSGRGPRESSGLVSCMAIAVAVFLGVRLAKRATTTKPPRSRARRASGVPEGMVTPVTAAGCKLGRAIGRPRRRLNECQA